MDKVQRLVDAAQCLAEQLDKVGEDSLPIFGHAANHHMPYTGATYEHELKALREVLAEFKEE